MDRFICLHAHFYQPPRENPWLESVEVQDSAYPYHDWNERITAECYASNARSRILDEQGRIRQIVNNYSRISFNFGPTLLSWMETGAKRVYAAVLAADKESQEHFGGHGSAIAQAYNHIIMPLANRADKETQVRWGIADFEHRFGRFPEGMWLPETAVDIETLEVLAAAGIKFTILAPYQAARFRELGTNDWETVGGGGIDPSRAYLANLPSGKQINLFFYDGPISRAVAFERLLNSGEGFANRLLSGFSEGRDWPQLMHIATDGETYGHHHPHGDMALAYAVEHIERNKLATVINYGQYLEKFPPEFEVEIAENTAWSCAHGVERWRSNCGCNTGRAGWNQEWRGPLRAALDWLRDEIAGNYDAVARSVFQDPARARNDYIQVVLDREQDNVNRFLREQSGRELSEAECVRALKLMEMQRHLMLMYTSCGWFFDEVSGIETVQVIMYAGRAIQLAEELLGRKFEAEFVERLGQARSNLPELADASIVYQRFVKPAMVDLMTVGANYAIASLFERDTSDVPVFCYTVDQSEYRSQSAGRARLGVGRALITSNITREKANLTFGVLHFGDHNISAGVREFQGEPAFQQTMRETMGAFSRADLPEVILLLDKHFKGTTYSLRSLFRDEQRRLLDILLQETLTEAESNYRQLYERHAPLMRFIGNLGMPQPRILAMTGEFVLLANLRRAFEAEDPDMSYIASLIEQANAENIALNPEALAYSLRKSLAKKMGRLYKNPADLQLLVRMDAIISLVKALPFPVNLWKVQNIYFDMLTTSAPEMAARNTREGRQWMAHFRSLGEKLSVAVPTELEAREVQVAS